MGVGWFHFLRSYLWYIFRNQNLIGQWNQSDIHKCTKKKKQKNSLGASWSWMFVHTLWKLYQRFKYKIVYQQIEQLNYLKHSCDTLVNGNENDLMYTKLRYSFGAWEMMKGAKDGKCMPRRHGLPPKTREQQWWDGHWRWRDQRLAWCEQRPDNAGHYWHMRKFRICAIGNRNRLQKQSKQVLRLVWKRVLHVQNSFLRV